MLSSDLLFIQAKHVLHLAGDVDPHISRSVLGLRAEVRRDDKVVALEQGIRELRFSVWNPHNAVVSFDNCLPLSEKIADMGWNV